MTALERVELPDDVEAVGAYLLQRGLTDGLPVVPPTEARVAAMVRGMGPAADPAAVIGAIPPLGAVLSLEKLAVCAVLAGCDARHLPVLEAAVRAVLEPPFVLQSIQTTTSAASPFLVVNGPARHAAGINSGAGCFGPGPSSAANTVIGRALRLVLFAVGGAVPGDVDPSPLGWPGKLTCCIGEHEEASPWEPLHVELGHGQGHVDGDGHPGVGHVADRRAQLGAVGRPPPGGARDGGDRPPGGTPGARALPAGAGPVADDRRPRRPGARRGRAPTDQAGAEGAPLGARPLPAGLAPGLPPRRHPAAPGGAGDRPGAPTSSSRAASTRTDFIVLVAGGSAGVQSAGLSTTVLSRSVTVEVAAPSG